MPTKFYFENNLFYVGNESIAPGICSFLLNDVGDEIEIRIAETRKEVVDMQPITEYTTKAGTAYNDLGEILAAVPGFFTNTVVNNSVQYPLATDGDSVYAKDIDIERSDLGDFSGLATDFFDNLHSENVNSESTNPKVLTIHFKRSVVTLLIGVGSSEGGTFSNVKITGILSGGVETVLADFSSDNTDRTTQFFPFPNAGINALKLEFYTADTVSITNIFIPKLMTVAAVLEATIKYADSYSPPYLKNGTSESMKVDGATTPVDFEYEITGLTSAKWIRSFVDLQDGAQNFNPADFGAISNGLANGVQIIVSKAGVETVIETWKTNMDISMTMYDFSSPFKVGAYVGRWTITKDIGSPVTLFPGDKIIVRINDNLTTLDAFRFRLKLSQ